MAATWHLLLSFPRSAGPLDLVFNVSIGLVAVETLDRDRCQGKILSAHRPRQAAYARKMEPHPEETVDFSVFSKMRRLQLDPESVIGRELLDRFAEFDESFTGHSRIWAVVVKLIGLTAMCSKAVIDLEKQVIELRREVRDKA